MVIELNFEMIDFAKIVAKAKSFKRVMCSHYFFLYLFTKSTQETTKPELSLQRKFAMSGNTKVRNKLALPASISNLFVSKAGSCPFRCSTL